MTSPEEQPAAKRLPRLMSKLWRPAAILRSPMTKVWRLMVWISGSTFGPFLGLVLVFSVFASIDAINAYRTETRLSFLTTSTIQQLARDSSITAVAALGMLLIIISGGIDLSVGAGMALCATAAAWLLREGYPPIFALSASLLTGCLIGLFNGVLITSLRLVPFIVTLGTMTLFQGIALVMAQPSKVDASAQIPNWVKELQAPYPDPRWLFFSTGVWVTLLLALLVGLILRYSVFGRRIFSIGSNEATARLCGINVVKTKIAVYTVAGFFTGIAGIFFLGFSAGTVDAEGGNGKELLIIAAVVIGGSSLSGGRGSLPGMLAASIIIELIAYGCTTLEVANGYKQMIIGAIIVAAVTLDQMRQRRLRE